MVFYILGHCPKIEISQKNYLTTVINIFFIINITLIITNYIIIINIDIYVSFFFFLIGTLYIPDQESDNETLTLSSKSGKYFIM